MNPQVLLVQKRTSGIPNSSAAKTVNPITPSDTMQLTGGTCDEAVSFSLEIRSLNGPKQVFVVDSQREGMSCVASTSDSGNPSGMVSNRKEERRLRE